VIKHLFKSDGKLHSMVLSLEGPKKTKEMRLLLQSAVKRYLVGGQSVRVGSRSSTHANSSTRTRADSLV
jgi:hypothetical protein